MNVTVELEPIAAGWFSFALNTQEDVEEFRNNVDAELERLHEKKNLIWPAYDDDGKAPRLAVSGHRVDGTVEVALYSADGTMLDSTTLPTSVCVWSYDHQTACFG